MLYYTLTYNLYVIKVTETAQPKVELSIPPEHADAFELALLSIVKPMDALFVWQLGTEVTDSALMVDKLERIIGNSFPVNLERVEAIGDRLSALGVLDTVGPQRHRAYKITDFGRIIQPIAEYRLWFEANHDIPLRPTFGSTELGKKGTRRAPYTSSEILLLLTQDTQRIADIAERTGFNARTVSSRLKMMHRTGVVDYVSFIPQTGENAPSYTLNRAVAESEHIQSIRQVQTLTAHVIGACWRLTAENTEITIDKVAEIVAPFYVGRDTKVLRHEVTSLLSALESEHSFLHRAGVGFKGTKRLSKASLTEKGHAIVDGFIKPILQVVKSGSVVRNTRELSEFRDNPRMFVLKALELDYPYSRDGVMAAHEVNVSKTFHLLMSRGARGITSRELADTLLIREQTALQYLQELESTGMATGEDIGGIFLFRSPQTEE